MWCCWISCIEIQWFDEGVCLNVLLICQIYIYFFCQKVHFLWLISIKLKSAAVPPAGPLLLLPPGSISLRQGKAGTGQLSARLRTAAWWEWCQFWLFFQAGPAYRGCSEKSLLQFIFSHSWILWNSCWFRPRLQDGIAGRNGKVFPFAFKRVLCSYRSVITTENTVACMPGK